MPEQTPRIRPILRLATPPARAMAPALTAGALAAAAAVALLAASTWLITRAAEQPPVLFLSMAVVAVRAFALARAVFRYLERLAGHGAAFTQLSSLRVGVVARILPIAPAGLGAAARGDVLSRLVRDVDDLADFPLRVIAPLVTTALVSVLSVAAVWFVAPSAAVALAAWLVLSAIVGSAGTAALAARAERHIAPLRGELADRVLEIIENLDVLSAYGALDERMQAVRALDARLRRASLRRFLGAGLQAALASLFGGAAVVSALLLTASAGLSGPVLAVVVLVPLAVFEVAGAVPAALASWRQVRASAERVAAVAPSVVPAGIPVDRPDAISRPADPLAPLLELHDVAVTWPDEPVPAVSGVSVTVHAGDRLVVTGPSGVGKTSLALALVRFLEYRGCYRVQGVEARDLPQAAVRRVVGLCEQDPWLFDNSIRQNLLFARDTATDDELLAVLGRVGLAGWVAERGGLDARVGERGALVSGGQAQRIAVARALLADFPVLVVDEPTANVDAAQGESLLRDIAAAAGTKRAVVFISHAPVPPELVTARLDMAAARHPLPAPV
ncbi:thiol reductant ABC exporter subunit CydC [Cryobacterium tepidiphilum]|nr:thiol reductant ABC exporter subunit CydC [Cryobacterium tepidiphilum]